MKIAANIFLGLIILSGSVFVFSAMSVIWDKNKDLWMDICFTSIISLGVFAIPFVVLQNKISDNEEETTEND